MRPVTPSHVSRDWCVARAQRRAQQKQMNKMEAKKNTRHNKITTTQTLQIHYGDGCNWAGCVLRHASSIPISLWRGKALQRKNLSYLLHAPCFWRAGGPFPSSTRRPPTVDIRPPPARRTHPLTNIDVICLLLYCFSLNVFSVSMFRMYFKYYC